MSQEKADHEIGVMEDMLSDYMSYMVREEQETELGWIRGRVQLALKKCEAEHEHHTIAVVLRTALLGSKRRNSDA